MNTFAANSWTNLCCFPYKWSTRPPHIDLIVYSSHIETVANYPTTSKEMLLAMDDTISWMIAENKEFEKNKSIPTIEKVLEKMVYPAFRAPFAKTRKRSLIRSQNQKHPQIFFKFFQINLIFLLWTIFNSWVDFMCIYFAIDFNDCHFSALFTVVSLLNS